VSDSGLPCNEHNVADMEDNIRIDRLLLGHGKNHETDISLASGSVNFISTGPYHDPWAFCIS